MLKGRHARNTITHLCDEHGNRVDEVNQIKGVAKEFYKKLLGTSQMWFSDEFADRITHLISPVISAESAALLEKPVTVEEIKKTMFNMPLNKAPGPDGFTTEFFKSYWSVVGEDVVATIQSFFDYVLLLKELNATILTLVPKKPNASFMGDFHPIACCNVIYKCITKIISNRMIPILDSLVSWNQSAFIPGRIFLKMFCLLRSWLGTNIGRVGSLDAL